MSVFKKLQQARVMLAKNEMKKSGHNKFAGYQYFELGDFLKPIQTIFDEVGLCGVVTFDKEVATLTIYETEGDGKIVFTSPMGSASLKGCHEVQNIGAVETYQRRYLYVAALEIVEHDAIDSQPLDQKEQVKSTSITQNVVDSLDLSLAVKEEAAKLALLIRNIYSDSREKEAHDLFYSIKDNDLKLAVWSELKPHSSIRSGIKKIHGDSV